MIVRSFDPTSVVAGPFSFSLSRGLFVSDLKANLTHQQEAAVGNLMLDRGGGIAADDLALLIGCKAPDPRGTIKVVLSQAKKALAAMEADLRIGHSWLDHWWWAGPCVEDGDPDMSRLPQASPSEHPAPPRRARRSQGDRPAGRRDGDRAMPRSSFRPGTAASE